MSKPSYVSIGRGVCVVCGQKFDAGTLMIEKQLPLEAGVEGWELCASDAQMHRLGFVALVECELDMTTAKSGDTIAHHEVTRTGSLLHVTRETFVNIFKMELRASLPCAYVPQGVLQTLRAILQRELN